jgi:hemoglobin
MSTEQTAKPRSPTECLYERLGGVDIVRALIDQAYERVLADDQLLPFFENIGMTRLKNHQMEFFKIAFGAAKRIEGRDDVEYMIEKHRKLFVSKGLNASHFDKVGGHIVASLQNLHIAPALLEEVGATVAPLRAAFEKGAHLYEAGQSAVAAA